jgi:uncharacterized protein
MENIIIQYQNAYRKITDTIKNNKNAIAIFIYGSMVSGDIWEESDIDLIVIYKKGFDNIRDIYTSINDVPIHIKILSKEYFEKSYFQQGNKGSIKNSLISSKLIFSNDKEISELYQKKLYLMEDDKEKKCLVYFGNLLKEIGVCKKYLSNSGLYTAYEVLIRALGNFSKIYLNMNLYRVSKDAITMVCKLNDDFNEKIHNLLYSENKEDSINKLLEEIENYIEANLYMLGKEIISFLEQKNEKLSSYEIKHSKEFKNFNIRMEDILKKLAKHNLIEKSQREFKDFDGKTVVKENIYYKK